MITPEKTVLASQAFEDPEFPLHIDLVTVSAPVPPHDHDLHEMGIILEGYGEHLTVNDCYQVGAGSILMMPPGVVHGFKTMHGITFANIEFIPEIILTYVPNMISLPGYRMLFGPRKRPRKSPVHFVLPPEALEHVEETLQLMKNEKTFQLPGSQAAMQSLLMYIIVLIVRSYKAHRGARTTPTPHYIEEIMAFLDEKYEEPFDADALANMAHLSRSQFFTAFKQYTGFSPLQYLLRTRVQHAQEYLATTDMNVTEIAFAVGFEDSNYFSRQFKRFTKISPSAYRREVHESMQPGVG